MDPKGYIKIKRKNAGNRPVQERIQDYGEVEQTLNTEDRKLQASRCMDCGVPFCHWACPVHSYIPDWQEALHRGDWQEASRILHATNDFPEFTGRVCPAPCETACTLAINDDAVAIRENEAAVVERAFEEGLIKPEPPAWRTGKKVAVVGSGPAGLSVAARLNQRGHTVEVFERDDAAGGLLRYGIPDFKLNKKVIDRRLALLKAEGITFRTGVDVGSDISASDLLQGFDAISLAIGAREPRDLPIKGRDLKGIHFAMDYLSHQNKHNSGQVQHNPEFNARGKHVVVIGGGDTGSDCVGTANRQGAEKVTQIEILPKPSNESGPSPEWPFPEKRMKTSTSHEEGCERLWNTKSIQFLGENGRVQALQTEEVSWNQNGQDKPQMQPVAHSKRTLKADLVLLAMGFVHPEHKGVVKNLGLQTSERGNISTNEAARTSAEKIFATGDAVSGASLVVTAIADGIETAQKIDAFLMQP